MATMVRHGYWLLARFSSCGRQVARRTSAFSTSDDPGGAQYGPGGDKTRAEAKPSRPKPRSAIAMAYFDHKIELEQRIKEEGTMPDTEAAFEILANHRIREAMRDGDFDHLPGKGKPLPAGQDDNFDISLKILKNSNMVPEWVEVGKKTRGEIAALRSRTKTALIKAGAPMGLDAATQRAEALAKVRESDHWKAQGCEAELLQSIQDMNRKIESYNAITPNAVVHIMPMRLDSELRLAMMDLELPPSR